MNKVVTESESKSVTAHGIFKNIADVSGSIRLFSDVMKRLGIRLDGDELYEEFQRAYDESVGRDTGKEKPEDRCGIGAEEGDSSAQYKIKNGCIIEH